MRQIIFISALVAFSLLTACDRQAAPAASTAPASSSTAAAAPVVAAPATAVATGPAVVGWGPRKAEQGKATNPQHGGEGLWIKVSGVKLTHFSVIMFDGKPVKEFHVKPTGDTITAVIPLEDLVAPGMKHIVLKTGTTGPELAVGDFEVTAAQ
jgi:hypothetical protein